MKSLTLEELYNDPAFVRMLNDNNNLVNIKLIRLPQFGYDYNYLIIELDEKKMALKINEDAYNKIKAIIK